MLVNEDLLITYGGVSKKFARGELVFSEGDMPIYYFQIMQGRVELYSSNESEKELTQGVFSVGQSFGEPPMLIDQPYPSTARVLEDSIIIRIRKEFFINILTEHPEIQIQFIFTFAQRIYHKATAAQLWLACTPEEKLSLLFARLKEDESWGRETPIPYTRHQLAKWTGLRTETVIRTLKRMSLDGKIIIKNRKLFLN